MRLSESALTEVGLPRAEPEEGESSSPDALIEEPNPALLEEEARHHGCLLALGIGHGIGQRRLLAALVGQAMPDRDRFPREVDPTSTRAQPQRKLEVLAPCLFRIESAQGTEGRRRERGAAREGNADLDHVGTAARDWPDLNFVIYHSAIEKVIPMEADVAAFRKRGRIDWVTRLAEIPEKFGVDNV